MYFVIYLLLNLFLNYFLIYVVLLFIISYRIRLFFVELDGTRRFFVEFDDTTGRSSGCAAILAAADKSSRRTGRSSGSHALRSGGVAPHLHVLEPRSGRAQIGASHRHRRLPCRGSAGGARGHAEQPQP